jgi:hypothetical protein
LTLLGLKKPLYLSAISLHFIAVVELNVYYPLFVCLRGINPPHGLADKFLISLVFRTG